MIIWFLMIVPIIATLVMFLFFDRKRIAWWEYLFLFGASALVIFISKVVIESTMVSDKEFWGQTAYQVEYEGAYDEYIHKTCTESYACGTDSDGNTKYCDRTYDCSYVENHGPKWRIKGSKGASIRISKSEYNRVKNKWGNEKKTGSHRNYHSYDDGIFGSFWLDRDELVECIVTSHRYENRVKVAKSVFNFIEVTDEDKERLGLYDYPKIYDGYKQSVIIGYKDDVAERKLQLLNGKLGPKKQVKVFILVFEGKTKEAGVMQEAYWKGGNKNEFILTIGIDKQGNVNWAHPFSWAERSIVKVNAREFVMSQEKLNLSGIADFLHDDLDKRFVRKSFSDFSYLTVEPTITSIVWASIILVIITIGLVAWFLLNDFDDNLMGR